MPGITISTAVRTGPTNSTVRESSQAFFVGKAERGPVDEALLVTSLEDFELKYGGYISGAYLHPTVESFFEEGGTQCYVSRVEGLVTGAVAASAVATIANDEGTPATAITLTVNGPGTWANGAGSAGSYTGLHWDIDEGAATGTRILSLYLDGDLIMSTGACQTTAQIVGKVNTHPVASMYMTAEETNAGVYTSEDTMPAATASLQPFADGEDADSSVTNAQYIDALDYFLDSFGTGVVAIPEFAEPFTASALSDVTLALIEHGNTYNRMVTVHGGATDTTSEIRSIARAIQAQDHSEHVGVYYPWVSAPTGVVGVNRWIPPTGYVAGARAKAHNQIGPHQPGAGIISDARFVNGVYTSIDKTTGDILDYDCVNAIRIINNRVRIYGARSCSSDTVNFRYINAQDVVNYVVIQANRSLEDVLFGLIDGRGGMFAAIEARLVAIMEPLRTLGALYEAFDVNGRRIDYGYTVKCNESLNPLSQLVDGTVTARVGLRVSSVGDSIQVDIIKSNLTTSVV